MARTRDILAGLLGAALAQGVLAADAAPAITGPWVLDAEHSDDPAAKLREAMESMRGRDRGSEGGGRGGPGGMGGGGGMGGPGGMGGGRGGGMGGPGGPGGRGTGSERESFDEPPLDGVRPRASGAEGEDGLRGPRGPVPSPQFVIEEHEGALIFSTERGSRRLRADGQKHKRDGADGRAREVVARWHEGGLEVKTGGLRGAMKERYRLREDGRLQVDFELGGGQGPMPAVKFRLVYARPALGAAEPR
ncbi:MAG: hypothetical protein NDJ94_06845 [Vicinamibacteria bacterium]|nr:hypothetical protein [Vicinamibacteria bacterium]